MDTAVPLHPRPVWEGDHVYTDVAKASGVGPTPQRKDYPLARGLLRMFPNALAAVAHCSLVGARQHGLEPGEWDRTRSQDHEDALLRHLMDVGTHDTDGVRHAAKVAWRALALLQIEIEQATRA